MRVCSLSFHWLFSPAWDFRDFAFHLSKTWYRSDTRHHVESIKLSSPIHRPAQPRNVDWRKWKIYGNSSNCFVTFCATNAFDKMQVHDILRPKLTWKSCFACESFDDECAEFASQADKKIGAYTNCAKFSEQNGERLIRQFSWTLQLRLLGAILSVNSH